MCDAGFYYAFLYISSCGLQGIKTSVVDLCLSGCLAGRLSGCHYSKVSLCWFFFLLLLLLLLHLMLSWSRVFNSISWLFRVRTCIDVFAFLRWWWGRWRNNNTLIKDCSKLWACTFLTDVFFFASAWCDPWGQLGAEGHLLTYFALSQKKLTCENYNPPQLCTPERYVTLRLQKRKLNLNRDYQFEIIVEKSE